MRNAARAQEVKAILYVLSALATSACEGGVCQEFEPSRHSISTQCERPDLSNPRVLGSCVKGSGQQGWWAVDEHGLPAFDFGIEQRCDSSARIQTSTGKKQLDPVHVLGNGRGLMAMAHASGAIEVYSQERGHAFLNHVDPWRDDENPAFPRQIGGGFNYVVVGDKVRSTRFDDMPVGKALAQQTRRFGVGYYETVTTYADLKITRRVFAPDSDARALVAEVTLENLSNAILPVGLVEFWDLNHYQVAAEAVSADLEDAQVAEQLRRSRREHGGRFTQTLSYTQEQIAIAHSEAKTLPTEVQDRRSSSAIDYFPADVFLAAIDAGTAPNGVWLSDDELWATSSTRRPPPSRAAEAIGVQARSIELDGQEQSGVLALRVAVTVPTGSPVVRRFAFGYAPAGHEVESVVAALRAESGQLADKASASWLERLAWVAVDAEDGGVIQREVAWSSYYAQAQASFSEMLGGRELGGGGATQFIAGRNASPGEQGLHSEALTYINPQLARENLVSALASQHGASSDTPWRFPLGTTGLDSYSDGNGHNQRSDSYLLLPAAVARYVTDTRDFEFLSSKTSFWPVAAQESGTVTDHLSRSLQYAKEELGLGALGLMATGTGDFEGNLSSLAGEAASSDNSSSVFNAAAALYGLPLVAEVVDAQHPDLASEYLSFLDTQVDALENQAFNGSYYERAFGRDMLPIGEGAIFLSVQVLPILSGLLDQERRDALLDLITSELDTNVGAVSQGPSALANEAAAVMPALNAWLTQAYALQDPARAWQSLLQNTMAAHADAYPKAGYGVWTGPSSFQGPEGDGPGQAMLRNELAPSDYPALSSLLHLAPLRGVLSLAGIHTQLEAWRIEPRFPSENFSIVLPRLELFGTASTIGGVIVASSDELLKLIVTLPSQAQLGALVVRVKGTKVEFLRGENNVVEFDISLTRNVAVSWSVEGA